VIELDSQRPFAGRYRVVRRIAAGGMGAVFEVVHIETHRRRALKVMLPELVANQELRERFQMEARVTAHVDSEYIVDVFDAGIDESTAMPFLVMELLQGEEFGAYLSRTGPIAPQDAVSYLRQVASALDKTHAAGIVHRDLKPENLFLTHREDGTPRIKILDFGISKVVNEAKTGNATRSLGTPLYMAPEQVLGQNINPTTDLYSLGLIAYSFLVGESYWQCDAERFENAIAFALHTTSGTTHSAVARAARAGRALPPAFDHWFRQATHLDPAQRFQRASDMVSALSTVLGSVGSQGVGTFSMAIRPEHSAQTGIRAVSPPSSIGTAPGTEFDRAGNTAGLPKKSRKVLWLSACAGLAAGAVALAMSLRTTSTVPTAAVLAIASASSAAQAQAPEVSVLPNSAPSARGVAPLKDAEKLVVDAVPSAALPSPTAKPSALGGKPAPGTKLNKANGSPLVSPAVKPTPEASPTPVHAPAAPYTRD
jgi:eukaryotic-like serine/threonine-protein kinase